MKKTTTMKNYKNKNFCENKDSNIMKFRKHWLKKGYELVNITHLIEPKLGCSGWCNNFHEPDENIYHFQLYYRKECIANLDGNSIYVIDDDLYAVYVSKFEGDFIIFRKVKI